MQEVQQNHDAGVALHIETNPIAVQSCDTILRDLNAE
jgi:hypothetical protein